jgi:hypothetical protein
MKLIKQTDSVKIDFSEEELNNDFIEECLEFFGKYSSNRYYNYESDEPINKITKIYRFKLMTINPNIKIKINDNMSFQIINNEDLIIYKNKQFKISDFPSLLIFFETQCPYLYEFYKNDNDIHTISIKQGYSKYFSRTKNSDQIELYNLSYYCFDNNQTFQFVVLPYLLSKFYNESTNFEILITSKSEDSNTFKFNPNSISRKINDLTQCLLSPFYFNETITDKIPFLFYDDNVSNLEIFKCMNNNILTSSNIILKYKDKKDLLLLSYINSLKNTY